MIRARVITGFVLLAIVGLAQAEEMPLTPDEIENLGIRFVSPSPASGAAGIEATARVVLPPAGDVVVSALQTGLLTRLVADIGDEVDEGQVLAELKSPEFISLQREFLDAANAQRLAQSEYERDAQLQAEGIISARRLQETTTRKAVADAALDEHRQLLRFAGMRAVDVRTLETQQRLQDSLLIRAPFSGVIAERMAATGERLDPMSPIYRLVDMSELWLDINVPQEELALVRPGARVTTTSAPGDSAAVITSVGRAIDTATQTAIARARFEAGVTGLRPGQLVTVRVTVDDGEAGAAGLYEVPVTAVTRSGTASYVFVRTANGVRVVEVEVVSVSGDRAWIRGQVGSDDTVAAAGISALKSLWAAGSDEDS